MRSAFLPRQKHIPYDFPAIKFVWQIQCITRKRLMQAFWSDLLGKITAERSP